MFAVYSYIAPTLTDVGGLAESSVPVFLFVFGVGMVAGTWLAGAARRHLGVPGPAGRRGRLDDRDAALLVAAPHGWWALPVVFLITVVGSVLVVNLQLRLMDVAGDAQTLGAAMNHASLNVANALGAWLGGSVIAAGYGYRSTSLVGAALSVAGIAVLLWSAVATAATRTPRRARRRAPCRRAPRRSGCRRRSTPNSVIPLASITWRDAALPTAANAVTRSTPSVSNA